VDGSPRGYPGILTPPAPRVSIPLPPCTPGPPGSSSPTGEAFPLVSMWVLTSNHHGSGPAGPCYLYACGPAGTPPYLYWGWVGPNGSEGGKRLPSGVAGALYSN
jgi:hypothetical protein